MMRDRRAIIEHVQQEMAQRELHEPEISQLIRQCAGGVMSDGEVLEILRQLRHDSVGVGPLEAILALPGVSDVLVNGPKSVWFDRGAVEGLERANLEFHSDAQVRALASRLLQASGRRIDDSVCYGDGRIQRDDGSSLRVHAILSPPAENGTCISLRVLRQSRLSLKELEASGTFNAQARQLLQEMITQRKSFLVVGGTGSGKTTLLAALLGQVAPRERMVLIEDTAELRPQHPHVVSLVTRAANTEGQGEVTMTDLIRQALRMRPDRIILGEIRGGEVVDLLTALNTGHEGCAGTVHANSIREVPARLEALAALGGMPREALHAQLEAASPMVLAMKRGKQGRRLHQIGQLRAHPPSVELLWEEGEHHGRHMLRPGTVD